MRYSASPRERGEHGKPCHFSTWRRGCLALFQLGAFCKKGHLLYACITCIDRLDNLHIWTVVTCSSQYILAAFRASAQHNVLVAQMAIEPDHMDVHVCVGHGRRGLPDYCKCM